eukprot:CAMPEP_0177783732 /NCGR_PEP_ID=MMETSP0491_2-20121128/19282_1 /TAXON_ID=63592 /ORGANISM="Tetraselmis chuii, Strain PLY429" /LENGTH=67 /DNA_ID=CAMNT_0019304367 /DNA_START=551 /DNA_END=750 /DNA_ORIENTATION=+
MRQLLLRRAALRVKQAGGGVVEALAAGEGGLRAEVGKGVGATHLTAAAARLALTLTRHAALRKGLRV